MQLKRSEIRLKMISLFSTDCRVRAEMQNNIPVLMSERDFIFDLNFLRKNKSFSRMTCHTAPEG